MSKRRSAALAVLALAAAAVFVLPASSASAGSATVSNACANSVTPNFSQIEVTTSGDDGLSSVAPGGATTTSGLGQSAAIPGDIFVAGYNLGLLVVGTNNIPANVRSTIEANNTVPAPGAVQNTNVVGGTPPDGSVSVTTVITDPDGTPGTGDETATDASFSVSYNNLSWTAGASGLIEYRQQSIAAPPPTGANNSLLINALVGGVFNVQFRCAPGTVTGPDPGVITLIDPAPSFDTTQIEVPQISISDPTVTEGGAAAFTVTLDQPSDQTVTVNFATADGTAMAPGDYTAATGTVTFAPGVTSQTVTVQTIDDTLTEETETFTVNLSNPTNGTIAVGTATGTILDNEIEIIDKAGEVIVNGPVKAGQTAKTYVLRVSNVGTTTNTVDCATEIALDPETAVLVNGVENGDVSCLTASKTIGPGARARFRLRWTGTTALATGDTVVFSACVRETGDLVTSNDCDSASFGPLG
jgi:fibronectin-binding autotransporter adhesin